MTPTNEPFLYINTVLYRFYIFRHHTHHPRRSNKRLCLWPSKMRFMALWMNSLIQTIFMEYMSKFILKCCSH